MGVLAEKGIRGELKSRDNGLFAPFRGMLQRSGRKSAGLRPTLCMFQIPRFTFQEKRVVAEIGGQTQRKEWSSLCLSAFVVQSHPESAH